MNKETDDRIKKMEKLIKDEAEEKARTIRENAEQQYNIEKNKIINQMKEKVLQEFREKLENYSVQKRIERSSKINNSRIKKMEQRFAVINKVREEAATKLRSQLSDPSIHKPLMKKLIIQGLIKLMEEEVLLKCRKEDTAIVESVLEEAEREFTDLCRRETGRELNTKLYLLKDQPLDANQVKCGGIVLYAARGRIVCSNTLDDRLNLGYEDSLPDIRFGLFPDLKVAEKPKTVHKPHHHQNAFLAVSITEFEQSEFRYQLRVHEMAFSEFLMFCALLELKVLNMNRPRISKIQK
eukprot:TRINITY_DN632_c0_g1_i4.p1 TRINITY_DN632_c0_g1~~TRINITY_DN632_c0_g1_i4.p1  ORF type:complete len:295 (-),score=107.72 TRINITY_DN632_c0_g1_i4:114-998(-)